MRLTIVAKSTANSEIGVPAEKGYDEIASCDGAVEKAGMPLDASDIRPAAKRRRIKDSRDKRTVVDGPFAETKELLGSRTLVHGPIAARGRRMSPDSLD